MLHDLGILAARLILGLALASHGAQKLFGWFGGYGLRGTGGFFENLGFVPGAAFALLAGLGEFVGGLLTAAGLFNPVGPALIVAVMVVAMVTVHWKNGFFATANGIELPLMNVAGAVALAFAGPGSLSLDAVVPTIPALVQPAAIWLVLIVAFAGSLLTLAARRRQPQRPAGA